MITKPVPGELSSSPDPAQLIELIKQTDDVEWVRLGLRLNLSERSIFRTNAGDQCDKGQNTCSYVIRTLLNSKGLYFTSGSEVFFSSYVSTRLFKDCAHWKISPISHLVLYYQQFHKNHTFVEMLRIVTCRPICITSTYILNFIFLSYILCCFKLLYTLHWNRIHWILHSTTDYLSI